jgi:NAD(P)H dehydrogenase (quinone)
VQVLVLHAHPDPASFNYAICDTVVRVLETRGHKVHRIDLYAEEFVAAMNADERASYETDAPFRSEQARSHGQLVTTCDAIVFVYPTWWHGVPAVMKGWFERVMVPGVGFALDPVSNKVRPGLSNIRRIAGITTYGSSRLNVLMMTDGGRRLIGRCFRMMANTRCRRTWLGLYGMDRASDADRAAFLARVESKLGKW